MDESTPESLLEDGETAAALATVLARAEETDGTVTWAEVRADVDAEVWGKLLADDALVDAGEAFVVADPPAVRRALEADGHEITTDAPVDDAGSGSWRPIDKAAGVGALVLMSGYQVSAIESPVVGAMDAVLGPAATVVPFPLLVLSVALGTATISTVVRRQLVDRDALESQKERMKRVRAKLKQARERGDAAAVERFEAEQRDLTQAQLGMLTRSLRPMVWTMLVTVPVFLWLSWLVVSPSTAIAHAAPFIPVIDRIAWTARVLGPMRLWMVWYVACQLASTLVVRRSLDRFESRRSVRI